MAAEKFTKADLVDAVHGRTKMDIQEIRLVLDIFVGEIKAALMQRRVIELRGFGTFEVRTRKARRGARNPKTGEVVSVNPRGSVVFRPGRDLKLTFRDIDAWAADAEGETPEAPNSQ